MSYDPTLLYERISLSLNRNPSLSLEELSRELRVSRRTIQNTIIAFTGKKFRDLREKFLLARFQRALVAEPAAAIKELSSEIGYGSPRSFARAIRRACGVSPEQLRARLAGELVGSKTYTRFCLDQSFFPSTVRNLKNTLKLEHFCAICPFSALVPRNKSSYGRPRGWASRTKRSTRSNPSLPR